MIHETGNRILSSLERRFGKLAMPQILRWIAGFQLMSWGLFLFSPEFLQWIAFDREAILSGEVWRVVSWVFFPIVSRVSLLSIFIVIIVMLFTFFINDSLERQWDSFRLNVYVISTIILIAIIGLIPFLPDSGILRNHVFFSSVFLAFATIYPNEIINLMGIIPIKAKWLGWADAAYLIGNLLLAPVATGPVILIGMLPYALTFVPTFLASAKQRSEVAVRRHKFEEGASSDNEAFHTCESCGATDETHPHREFRVSADGHEYCEECRAQANDN